MQDDNAGLGIRYTSEKNRIYHNETMRTHSGTLDAFFSVPIFELWVTAAGS